jgi:hypothetical protein
MVRATIGTGFTILVADPRNPRLAAGHRYRWRPRQGPRSYRFQGRARAHPWRCRRIRLRQVDGGARDNRRVARGGRGSKRARSASRAKDLLALGEKALNRRISDLSVRFSRFVRGRAALRSRRHHVSRPNCRSGVRGPDLRPAVASYARVLLAAAPRLEPEPRRKRRPSVGEPPSASHLSPGCVFSTRSNAERACNEAQPLTELCSAGASSRLPALARLRLGAGRQARTGRQRGVGAARLAAVPQKRRFCGASRNCWLAIEISVYNPRPAVADGASPEHFGPPEAQRDAAARMQQYGVSLVHGPSA